VFCAFKNRIFVLQWFISETADSGNLQLHKKLHENSLPGNVKPAKGGFYADIRFVELTIWLALTLKD